LRPPLLTKRIVRKDFAEIRVRERISPHAVGPENRGPDSARSLNTPGVAPQGWCRGVGKLVCDDVSGVGKVCHFAEGVESGWC